MKTLKTIVLATSLYCISPLAHGGERVEGGLGLKLGDIFDLTKAAATNIPASENIPQYLVRTTNVHQAFPQVFVEITPKTHKIYRIVGRGRRLSDEDRRQLVTTLREKYDTTTPSESPSAKVIDQGDRYIMVIETSISGYDGALRQVAVPAGEIRYTDTELENLAIKEAAEKKFGDKSIL